jgi:RHS repeat-associated protein
VLVQKLGLVNANTHTTSFTYDAYGRVTRTTFPSSYYETYIYDADNNLTSKTDRKSQTVNYVYDALNRLSSKTYPDTTSVAYTYDLVGKVLSVNDPTGTYGFSYDNMGRLTGTSTAYSFLTGTYTNAYTYDAASNRTGYTAPDSSTNTYSYDTLNRLNTLASSWAGSFGFSYDSLNRRTQMTRPNSITTNYTYDSLSRLLTVLHQSGSSTIDGASYTLDSAGNRTAKADQYAGVTANYTYDPLYELTQVTQASATTESYSYDPVGNRTASLGVSSYTTNSSNEMTANSNASYTYDYNGNTTGKTVSAGTTNYTWDYENRLASVTLPSSGGVVTFKYDPFGRRVQKVFTTGTTTTTNYLYDGDNDVEELDASGAVLARYTQGASNDEPLAESRSSTTSFYEADGLGSITSLTNGSGAIANSYTYDSFGNLTASSGSITNPFQYTGRDFDSESGLRYYRARYYDPTTGRFLSEDPSGFEGGVDLYAYVSNSPTNLHDPTGKGSGIVVVGGGTVSVTTTITVTTIGESGASAPVLSLIAGGSGSGSTAGPVGALVGIIAAVGTYDAIQLDKLCQAYGMCGPGKNPQPKCDKDDCEIQRENDWSVCRALPDARARGRCWRSAAERYQNCRRKVYVPPLVTDPDE